MIEKSTLIREYVTALRQKNASIFIGSGMSNSIFKKCWKELIRPYAKKIKFPLKKTENNYPFIAQSYVNNGYDKGEFKKSIGEQFSSSETTEFHHRIARLPIRNYWTTNYDPLIENALKAERKHYDLIYDNESFTKLDDEREHIVFKCHGDYNHPDSIIITEEDYEHFKLSSFNFTHAIYNELASSTVLFLGYSFSDPDIQNIISTLTTVNKINQNHYFITKKCVGNEYKKQKLWIKNLERYSIHTLLIDDYNDIESIMKEIEQQYMAYKILISGSAVEYDKFADKKTAQDFIYKLGYELIRSDCSESDEGHGLRIVNGNGLGVGPFLYEGIAEATATYGLDMADYLLMYPFPKTYYEQFDKEKSIEEKYYAYREKMISKCGIAFFIFGNKYDKNGNVINADGVRKEFDIAVKQKKYVFPIGATGYMAKELADTVLSDFELYNGEMPNIKILLQELNSDEITPDNIIKKMVKIIDILAFTPECK